MPYFDHVRCHSCKAMLDPETLRTREAGPTCPKCGVVLSMTDLFGLSSAFAEEEEEPMSIDDLVSAPPAAASPKNALEAMRSLKKR